MRDFSQDHRWMSMNSATLRKSEGKDFPLTEIIKLCAAHNVRAISPWRDQVHAVGLDVTEKLLADTGIELSGYCRGGFFTGIDKAARDAALADNERAIEEALTLNAPCLVMVVGSLPGALQGKPRYKDIGRARDEVLEGLSRTLETAKAAGLPLALEPLHPMQAAERACINTLEHALDICDQLDHAQTGSIGVAVDAYHTWWDPKLQQQTQRAGKKRLLAWHVCDWLTPTTDLLNDRGMMGDGIIELKKIRGWMEDAGYEGYAEVEIFSEQNWWQGSAQKTALHCIENFSKWV